MGRAERRKDPRVELSVPIKYRLTGDLMGMWHQATLTDLSVGGIRFTSGQLLHRGEEIEVQLSLPVRRESYVFQANVVWVKDAPAGLEYGAALLQVTTEKQVEIGQLVHFLRDK